jgi:hypothetical protein
LDPSARPEKPAKRTCEDAAAALFGNLKVLRAAIDAAGKGGSLEVFRREATQADEKQWLLEVRKSK